MPSSRCSTIPAQHAVPRTARAAVVASKQSARADWSSASLSALVVRRQDRGRRRWSRAAPRPAPPRGSRRGWPRTRGERRSRSASSSRTSAQVKSSCWRARLPASPSSPRCSRCPSTRCPHVVDADVGQARAGHDRWRPRSLAVHQPERAGQLAGRGPGLLLPVAVGLVDRDHVGDLEDALLDALQLVAGAGQGEEEEGVDHPGHGDLRLPDPDRLDQHHVVPRRLEHRHRLAGGPGDAAERAGGRRRPDVGVRVAGQLRHPGLVAEDRAAGADAGRVHREHADPVPVGGQPRAEGLDEGGLPDARDPGDADPAPPASPGRPPARPAARARPRGGRSWTTPRA